MQTERKKNLRRIGMEKMRGEGENERRRKERERECIAEIPLAMFACKCY